MKPSFAVQLDYLVHRVTHCGWNIGPRTINNFELVLVTAGEGRIAWDDRTFTARAGDLICFVPGVRHRLWVDGAPCMGMKSSHQAVTRLSLEKKRCPPMSMRLPL